MAAATGRHHLHALRSQPVKLKSTLVEEFHVVAEARNSSCDSSSCWLDVRSSQRRRQGVALGKRELAITKSNIPDSFTSVTTPWRMGLTAVVGMHLA
eukprot:4553520-Amphidinium_carterae.1